MDAQGPSPALVMASPPAADATSRRLAPTPGPTAEPPDAPLVGAVEAAWFLRSRWGVAAGLVAWSLLGQAFGTRGARGALAVGAIIVASNLWLRFVGRLGPSTHLLGAVLGLDATLLTVILHLNGGPSNPASVAYLPLVTFAAARLGAVWTWGLAIWSIAAYGSLFLLADTAHHLHLDPADYASHLAGMWLALAAAALFVAFFANRLNGLLRARAAELRELSARDEVSRRLISVMTLAAGAAHELATPLGTIAVAASELERSLLRSARPVGELDDARLISQEVSRCRSILERMRPEATVAVLGSCSLPELIERAVSGLSGRERLAVSVEGQTVATLPALAVEQIVRVLVSNALDVARTQVAVTVHCSSEALVIAVRDDGAGMSPEVSLRAGEPFFTTKELGHGIGLGLFVARATAASLGGEVDLASELGRGTTGTLRVPLPVAGSAGGSKLGRWRAGT